MRIAECWHQGRRPPSRATGMSIAAAARLDNPQNRSIRFPRSTDRNDMIDQIRRSFSDSVAVKNAFVAQYADQIADVAKKLVAAFKKGHKVLLFGNGGSATDASHIAGEWVNRFNRDREGLPAMALACDPSIVTSIGNDYDFQEIFSRQVRAFGRKGDVAIAISTSGNSPNVLRAVEAAKPLGLLTVGFTGKDGGKLASMVDQAFIVPSDSTPRIQETHITLGHVLCELVEDALFPPGR
ncbi:MAG: D-sedoheptulose 7-phosphate isomerase [Armatimonadota bacterium]|nr:D-sedoheptulose 7-phosphate isomerase [Armatimonadota bacterium]